MTPEEEQAYQKWLSTFGEFFDPDEATMIVIRKPSDMDKVYDMLEAMEI